MRALAGPGAELEAAARYARGGDDAALSPGDAELHALLKLARAASPSPAELDAETVAACRESELSARAIVELITWLSVLQMLHRLSCFYAQ